MRLSIFGGSISRAWGGVHTTFCRDLLRALAEQGHEVTYFERTSIHESAPCDYTVIPNGQLVRYAELAEIQGQVSRVLADADAALVTSSSRDARAAAEIVLESSVPMRAFYDLDPAQTLRALAHNQPLPYAEPDGLRGFDVAFAYATKDLLGVWQDAFGAPRVESLYAGVDPSRWVHQSAREAYRSALSYTGIFAQERQACLTRLLVEPARTRSDHTFTLVGSRCPESFTLSNITRLTHVPNHERSAFYSSARLCLDLPRTVLAHLPYAPSEHMFEAAACGAPLITSGWDGLQELYEPGREVLVARDAADVLRALELSDRELRALGEAARERTLVQHSIGARAQQLVHVLTERCSGLHNTAREGRLAAGGVVLSQAAAV